MFFTTLGHVFEVLFLLLIAVMTAQALFNIRLRLFIWEKPEHAWLNHAPTVYREPRLSFTILLPARHEERVYRETIENVYHLRYPKALLQLIAICREDDPGTIAEARATIDALGDPNVQLLIFNDQPINKPHGLNLGMRLSLAHARVRILYDDEYVTREETPHTIEQFVRQRTRWNQGFIQILFKWEWLKLPKLSQRLLAFFVLVLPELQAFFALLIPVSLAMFFLVNFPLWLAMLTFLPLYCFVLGLLIDLAGLREFLKAHGRKWRWDEAMITILALFPYQGIFSGGALRGVYRSMRGVTKRGENPHVGQHRAFSDARETRLERTT